MTGFRSSDLRGSVLGMTTLSLIALLLSGCMSHTTSASTEQKRIIIGINKKDYYPYSYGAFIGAAFPDLQVELVELEPDYSRPISEEQYERKVKEGKIDLLLGNSIHYKQLAADGLLADLSLLMQNSKMKEDDFYPGMIQKMKHDGGGSLYAVASSFQASLLYYNADLFRKYNISPPQNGMTMMDVVKLAGQFAKAGSNKDGVVGYHQPFSSMPNNLLFSLSSRENLRPYNFTTGKVTIDSPGWRAIISTVIELYQNGTFKMQDVKGDEVDGEVWYGDDDVSEADMFKQGKSAMTIGSYNSMNEMTFEIGSVTPPVSSVDQRSDDLGIYSYLAIPAGAEHGDVAWDIIQFMLSDYLAKVNSGLQEQYQIPTRKSYMKYDHNPVLSKLYEILPSIGQSYSNEGYDPKFMKLFAELEDREITSAVKGQQSVEACIAAIQKEGQALMDAAKPKPEPKPKPKK